MRRKRGITITKVIAFIAGFLIGLSKYTVAPCLVTAIGAILLILVAVVVGIDLLRTGLALRTPSQERLKK